MASASGTAVGAKLEEGRKETYRKPSTQNRKEGTGNQAGKKGRDPESVSGTEAPRKPAVRRKREESGKEEQKAE